MTDFRISKPVDSNRTRNDLRHMFEIWGIEQFSIMREQEEFVSGAVKRGNGVTVTYLRKTGWQTVFCNHFPEYSKNMRAIFLFLDRVRIAEKSGISYQGLSSTKDLVKNENNAKGSEEESLDDAFDVLGVSPDDPVELLKRFIFRKYSSTIPTNKGETLKNSNV